MAAANLRDNAEGAWVIAAFGNLDVGEVLGGETEARRIVVGDIFGLPGNEVLLVFCSHESLDDGCDGGDLVKADKGVNVWHEAGEFLREPLGQAAGNDDFLFFALGSAFLAGIDGIVNGSDRFLLRHVDEGACVDDEDVGKLRLRGHGHASLLEVTNHDFGIDKVFSAA